METNRSIWLQGPSTTLGGSGKRPVAAQHPRISRLLITFSPFVLLFVLICATIVLGVHATSDAMILRFDTTTSTPPPINDIVQIEDVDLDEAFFFRLPLFFRLADEKRWWQKHRDLNEALSLNKTVTVTFSADGLTRSVRQTMPQRAGSSRVLASLSSIYFIALLFVAAGFVILVPQRSEQSLVLASFMLFCALYLLSAAPIVTRDLTLPFGQLRLLVVMHYLANAGLLTLIHYALVFPRRKSFVNRLPVPLPVILYGYAGTVSLLYTFGVIPFGATDPILFVWLTICIGSFVHSIAIERDPFLRNQIILTLSAPILVATAYAIFNLTPASLGASSERFIQFAIFTAIMAFALPAAMDNVRLYRRRVEVERESNEGREKIREELHDRMLRELASISILAQASALALASGSDARLKIDRIKSSARGYSSYVRRVMQIADSEDMSWLDFTSHLREAGYDAVEFQDLQFSFALSDPLKAMPPQVPVMMTIYKAFTESIANTLKHAQASKLDAGLTVTASAAILELQDNGVGFDKDSTPDGHYGLEHTKRAVEQIGGSLTLETTPGHGTTMRASIPIKRL